MNPIATALNGKGFRKTLRRARTLTNHYGPTDARMRRALDAFGQLLQQYQIGATFPITAIALDRNPNVIDTGRAGRIEFAVHGYCHIDHSLLSEQRLLSDFRKARRVFAQNGLSAAGFRAPYLRLGETAARALSAMGFQYDSSPSLAWDVLGGAGTESYRHALEFYGARPAGVFPALPRIRDGLVEIPYCLPDDEALIERLDFPDADARGQPWLEILSETYRLGELFTLGLHPERIFQCQGPLRGVLERAKGLSPRVWIARLDEVAEWWRGRAGIEARVTQVAADEYRLEARESPEAIALARGVEAMDPAHSWDGEYMQATGIPFRVRARTKPIIGISPESPPTLESFLSEQGYVVENGGDPTSYSIFLDRPGFDRQDERAVLAEIEGGDAPLVKLARWPHGARSALCVTGDIDALTLWDYLLRMIGR